MIPRPAGGRKWPTKWRRAENQAGQAGVAEEFDDPNEASEARARASEAQLLIAAAAGEHEALRWLLDDVAPVVYGFLFAQRRWRRGRPPRTCCRRRCSKLSGVRRLSGASRRFPPGCAQLQGAGWPATTRPKGAPKWREGRYAWWTPTLAAGLGADLVERQDEVVRALGRLPALQRQVLVLKYLEDLSVEDIADQVSRSRVQVQSLLQRGREGLRRQLGAQGA